MLTGALAFLWSVALFEKCVFENMCNLQGNGKGRPSFLWSVALVEKCVFENMCILQGSPCGGIPYPCEG